MLPAFKTLFACHSISPAPIPSVKKHDGKFFHALGLDERYAFGKNHPESRILQEENNERLGVFDEHHFTREEIVEVGSDG